MAYAGLERDPERERKGYVWQADLPDTFTCSCRSTDVDLRSLRKGLHGLLGHLRVNAAELEEFSFQLLYDNVALRAIYNAARSLIYGDPTEQAVQSFLEQNPVLLGTFAPWRIVPKAPVLSLFRTDFLVISSSGHLRLVEIEKPSKALMRKNGVPSAEFTQALHQVQQWLAAVREHKAAVLDPLGIDSKRVTRVTGVLVMGRDDSCPPNQLAILKSSNRDEIEFYTYDDLLGAFANLISTLPTAPPTEILNPNLLAEFEGSSS
jgi:hypothetical protein